MATKKTETVEVPEDQLGEFLRDRAADLGITGYAKSVGLTRGTLSGVINGLREAGPAVRDALGIVTVKKTYVFKLQPKKKGKA